MNSASLAGSSPMGVRRMRPGTVLVVLAIVVVALALASLQVGALSIPPGQVAAIVASAFGVTLPADVPLQNAAVLLSIRLPRIVLGLAAGAGLGAAGAVLQGVFRNPLADPMLIGVSSGAALFVTAVIVLGAAFAPDVLRMLGPFALPAAGFAGGLGATMVLYRVATRDGRTSLTTMLLAGIAINALAFAGIGLFTSVASNEQLRNISFWNFGSLAGAQPTLVYAIGVCVVVACVALTRTAPGLDALLLGDIEARHLGVDTDALKRRAIAWSALLAGFTVAACGVIGFVALVAPHIVRLVCGPGHRVVIPGAALLGAILLLGADLVARSVVAPAEMPIGIVTALIGAPFFLWLLVRHRDRLA